MPVLTITNDNFEAEVVNSGVPVLVDFWADWCGPCRMVAPVVEAISEGAPGFKVGKIDVDREKELAARFEVFNIPTLIVFKNGEETGRAVGVKSKEYLLKMIEDNK